MICKRYTLVTVEVSQLRKYGSSWLYFRNGSGKMTRFTDELRFVDDGSSILAVTAIIPEEIINE